MKKKKGIVTIVAAVIVIAVIAVAVITLNAVKDPKTKVIRAFARLFSEDVGSRLYDKRDNSRGLLYSRFYQTNKAYRKSAEKALQGKFAYDASLALDRLDADIPGIKDVLSYISGVRFNVEGAADLKEERIRMSAGLSYAIVSIPKLTLDVSGSEAALSADGVFDGALTVDTEGMGTAFNSSELSHIFGIKLNSEQVAALDKGLFTDDKGISKDDEKAVKAFLKLYDSVQVDESSETRTIFIDGKTVDCDVYPIRVQASDINMFLDEIGAEDIDVQNDCTMEAALTPKGNLAYFECEFADYVFDMEIRSEECARNDMNMMLAKAGKSSFEFVCRGSEQDNVRKDDVTMDINIAGRPVTCEMSFETSMSPSGIEIDADEISISSGNYRVALTGDVDLLFDADEIEDIPEPKREILKMSEADFDSLGVEIYDHLMQNDLFAMVLSQFGGQPVIGDLIDLMNSGR